MMNSDIASLASTVTRLSKTRTGWKGLCPFHKEDTPSFFIDENKQMFYCHGCGVGGGYIKLYKLLKGELPVGIPVKRNDAWESTGQSLAAAWTSVINKKTSGKMDDAQISLDVIEVSLSKLRDAGGWVGREALGMKIPVDSYVALRASPEFRKLIVELASTR